jgi:2-amino-4-hydroxy-6-hydroxymethyldihydropteridine diphosphokinase/dihydropteroate synthase
VPLLSTKSVVLGVGSNLGDRAGYLLQALGLLTQGNRPILTAARSSLLFESEALLLPDSPPDWNIAFLNAAIAGATHLSPQELLAEIKAIEGRIGRQNRGRWSPREIDIDILWYNNEEVQTASLSIPHPELTKRPFALWPLIALEPQALLHSTGLSGRIHAIDLLNTWGMQRSHIPCRTWKASWQYQRSFAAAATKIAPACIQVSGPLPHSDIVGILNITPDSFSDGGALCTPELIAEHAKYLFESGASILDIGAESTRPNASATPAAEEQRRLLPALAAVRQAFSTSSLKPLISVDTRTPIVARAALDFGIDWLNSVEGFEDHELLKTACDSSVQLVAMHSLSLPPRPDKVLPQSPNAVEFIRQWLARTTGNLVASGIDPQRIILDPGIGFGKTAEQSFQLIGHAGEFATQGYSLLYGHSRKSFLSILTNKPFDQRDSETALLSAQLSRSKIDYLRVHDVQRTALSLGLLR